jgi:hypothetical protein
MNPDMPHQPEGGSPQAVLFAEIKSRLQRTPFEPFRIVTTSGESYDVPTGDHGFASNLNRTVYVIYDGGGTVMVHAIHVSAIENLPRPRRRRSA